MILSPDVSRGVEEWKSASAATAMTTGAKTYGGAKVAEVGEYLRKLEALHCGLLVEGEMSTTLMEGSS